MRAEFTQDEWDTMCGVVLLGLTSKAERDLGYEVLDILDEAVNAGIVSVGGIEAYEEDSADDEEEYE